MDLNTSEDKDFYYKKAKLKAKTNLMWIFLFSIIMFFAALTSAYIVSKGDSFWVEFDFPKLMWISTFIILLSSVFAWYSLRYIRENKVSISKRFLTYTLVLGIIFCITQYYAWKAIYNNGYAWSEKIYNNIDNKFFMEGTLGKDFDITYKGGKLYETENKTLEYIGKKNIILSKEEFELFRNKDLYKENKIVNRNEVNGVYSITIYGRLKLTLSEIEKLKSVGNVSSSYFYTLTFAHFLHIFFAIIYLIILIIKKAQPIENYINSIKIASIFWHFLTILWIYLAIFLFYIH